MKVSLSKATFIPVTKANLARKSPIFIKIRRKPNKGWSSIRLPYSLQCLNKLMGFTPRLKNSLMVVVIEGFTFRNGGFSSIFPMMPSVLSHKTKPNLVKFQRGKAFEKFPGDKST
ncbi:hypothetical protein FF1_028128 [Malus domestica]